MFSLFKKNKKLITKNDYSFLKALTSKLTEYDFIRQQVNDDFIIDKRKAYPTEKKGSFAYILNSKLEKEYTNNKFLGFYKIKKIIGYNHIKSKPSRVDIYLINGMISGYYSEDPIIELDFSKFDMSEYYVEIINDIDRDDVKKIIGNVENDILHMLDVDSAFKINISQEDYYVIKKLGNGNYISIDCNGAVYGMIHDPYEVEKIFDNIEQFFKALKADEFNFDYYLNQKMS